MRAITPRPQLNTSTQFACAHTAPNSVLMWTSTTRVFHFDKSVHSTNYFPFTELQYCIRRCNIYAYERGQLKNLMCFALSLTVDLVWVVGTAFGVPSLFLHPLALACSLSFSSLSTTVYAHELKSFEMFLIKRKIEEGKKRCEMFEWLSSIFALLFLRLIGTFNATERKKKRTMENKIETELWRKTNLLLIVTWDILKLVRATRWCYWRFHWKHIGHQMLPSKHTLLHKLYII